MTLGIVPITLRAAREFVTRHHRHHGAPRGHKFSVAVAQGDGAVCGVAIVGRPVSRCLDDGYTLEVIRLCTDGTRNACSKLYAACVRAAKALGYRRLVTYTLESESGASLRAAGWVAVGKTKGGEWDCPSRRRKPVETAVRKVRWEPLTMRSVQLDTGEGAES